MSSAPKHSVPLFLDVMTSSVYSFTSDAIHESELDQHYTVIKVCCYAELTAGTVTRTKDFIGSVVVVSDKGRCSEVGSGGTVQCVCS